DALHAARHGGSRVALGHADSGALVRSNDGAAAAISGGRLGTGGSGPLDGGGRTKMAQSVVDRAWRTTTADDIEPHLAELWRELGRQRPVARAVMSNLVVVRERSRGGARPTNVEELVDEIPLNEVVAQHPSRVVLIQHDRAPQTASAPSAISVGVVTYGPPHARYGVEEIVVQSACAEQSLPSIIRRLLRGDVPTSVWWTDDLSRTPPLDAIV